MWRSRLHIENLQQLAEAYTVLSDRVLCFKVCTLSLLRTAAKKRAIYDQHGEKGLKQGAPDGLGGVPWINSCSPLL